MTGIFEDAERQILIVGAQVDEKEFYEDEFLSIIEVKANEKIEHRQVLGSVLGTGISRDVIGDIVIKDNIANIIVSKKISKYIIQNLDKVGKEKVLVREIKKDEILEVSKNFKEIKTTVASLRIDAVISACFGISRELSSKLIDGEKVILNYKAVSSSTKQVKQGDLISVRGYGKFLVSEILGTTRKDRTRVVFEIYA